MKNYNDLCTSAMHLYFLPGAGGHFVAHTIQTELLDIPVVHTVSSDNEYADLSTKVMSTLHPQHIFALEYENNAPTYLVSRARYKQWIKYHNKTKMILLDDTDTMMYTNILCRLKRKEMLNSIDSKRISNLINNPLYNSYTCEETYEEEKQKKVKHWTFFKNKLAKEVASTITISYRKLIIEQDIQEIKLLILYVLDNKISNEQLDIKAKAVATLCANYHNANKQLCILRS